MANAAVASEWSGYPDPTDPDNFWIDDETGERVCAATGTRTPPIECATCRGNGWIAVRRHTPLLKGVFEEDCPDCTATGEVQP